MNYYQTSVEEGFNKQPRFIITTGDKLNKILKDDTLKNNGKSSQSFDYLIYHNIKNLETYSKSSFDPTTKKHESFRYAKIDINFKIFDVKNDSFILNEVLFAKRESKMFSYDVLTEIIITDIKFFIKDIVNYKFPTQLTVSEIISIKKGLPKEVKIKNIENFNIIVKNKPTTKLELYYIIDSQIVPLADIKISLDVNNNFTFKIHKKKKIFKKIYNSNQTLYIRQRNNLYVEKKLKD